MSVEVTPFSRVEDARFEAWATAIAVIETEECYQDLANRIREANVADAMAEAKRRFIDRDEGLEL